MVIDDVLGILDGPSNLVLFRWKRMAGSGSDERGGKIRIFEPGAWGTPTTGSHDIRWSRPLSKEQLCSHCANGKKPP
jgi:hypothetical protein